MVANGTVFDLALLLSFIKIAILILLFLYAIFALLIVRQTQLMVRTLSSSVSGFFKAVAIIHAGFAIGFLVLAFGLL